MYIGVQTKGIIPEKSIENGIAAIKKAGFDRIDFNLDCFLKNTDLYNGQVNKFFDKDIDELIAHFLRYREAMEKHGIKASQMHAPYPVRVAGRGEQNEYMMGNVIPKSLIIAEVLQVPWVVIHPFKMQYIMQYENGKQTERKENIEYFKMLIPILKQCKVGVCFENLYEGLGQRLVEGVCADPEEAIWYIDTLNEYAGEELFGFCLDTGHLQLVKRDPYEFITKLGKRLKVLHLHENDTIGDLHHMPYTFGKNENEGQDWNGIYRALKEIEFDGTLSFETFPCMNSFPKGMNEAVLKTIYSIGDYMRNQITK